MPNYGGLGEAKTIYNKNKKHYVLRPMILNIANLITALRLLLGLPLLYFIYADDKMLSVLLYVAFLMLDVLDGFAAKKFRCETVFGKNFDFITDGVVGLGVVLVLLITEKMSLLYLALLAIPLAAKTIYIAKGMRVSRKTFVPAEWRKLNGAVLFMIPLMFIIGHVVAVAIAYVLLVYVYVSSVKYINEIRHLTRK
jgi:CDP-diacylglycerol--glycerol-3-phosphate 3-phosphatidyltransferase